ncbi:MAG: RNA polymerase sigma factor [Planctomycetaceae bacterium]
MDENSCVRDLPELVKRYSGLLYRYAYRLSGCTADAEDLTQQTFLTAHRKLDQLRDIEHAKGWLCAILRTTYLKNLRSRPKTPSVSLENIADIEGEAAGDPALDSEELNQILGELPEEFRIPIVLFYFQDFSYKDIADQLDIPVGTVMSRLARGKLHLRKRLATLQSAAN